MLEMKVSPKKLVQAATAVILICCYTTLVLLLQQGSAVTSQETSFQDGENRLRASAKRSPSDGGKGQVKLGFQERAPRSIDVGTKEHDYNSDNSLGNNRETKPTSLTELSAGFTYGINNHNRSGASKDTGLSDIFISVKTTSSFHQSRLDVILKTWFVLAREQTYFFSDSDDPILQLKTNGHLINTNCSSSHNRKALCCKMSVEFDTFLDSDKKWFCHFDDDNYVNVPRLVRLLQRYNPREDWYLGKPSIRAPLEIFSRDNPKQKIAFWFATGGAGFCISRALALKMVPLASGGKFISIGEKIRLPDDVTMGYVIEHLLKNRLTVVEEFHSHLEPMKFLKADSYADQVTFSYSRFGREMNVLAIEGFDTRIDPTRFLSLHCHLFPNFSFCMR